MSNATEKYRHYIDQRGLTDEQAEQLIGALTHIVERILDQKYLLRKECDEKTRR